MWVDLRFHCELVLRVDGLSQVCYGEVECERYEGFNAAEPGLIERRRIARICVIR